MGNRFMALALVVALALVGLFTSLGPAVAQDTWSGKNESVVAFGATITTPAVVVTATTGKIAKVKAFTINSGTAGNVFFQTSSTVGDGIVGVIYCAANTPQQIPETILGEGIKSTSGGTLYLYGPGTIVITARVQKE